MFIKILKNWPKIVIFHWFLIKNFEIFSRVRGAQPPGTPHAATPYNPGLVQKIPPPPRPCQRMVSAPNGKVFKILKGPFLKNSLNEILVGFDMHL